MLEEKLFEKMGIFVECSSNAIPRINTLKRFADLITKMGYNYMYLGVSDTYEIEGEEYFGYNRGRYTEVELKELDEYCLKIGLELRGAIQVLAHLPFEANYETYRDLYDIQDVLMVGDERVYALIDKMFASMSKYFTSRTVHIGMDEAFLLGLGKYLKTNGYKSRVDIFTEHLNKVAIIAKKYGINCEMWSDMFFRLLNNHDGRFDDLNEDKSEQYKLIKRSIPENVKLIYWNYLSTDFSHVNDVIKKNLLMTNNLGYAGGIWKWFGFAPDNEFSISMGNNAMKACQENGVKEFMLTLWADSGADASLFSVLPGLFYYAEYANGRTTDINNIDKARFQEIVGVNFDDFMFIDKLNKPQEKEFTRLNNKSYYNLYNDLLLGTADSLVAKDISQDYKKVFEKLSKINGGEFNYIFDTLTILAKILYYKSEIGITLKELYDKKDKPAIMTVIKDKMNPLITAIEEFFNCYKKQWNFENKGFGFEVQCIRIGGLKQRIIYVQELLTDYVEGRVEKIDEFETKKMPHNYRENMPTDGYIFHDWKKTVTNGYI